MPSNFERDEVAEQMTDHCSGQGHRAALNREMTARSGGDNRRNAVDAGGEERRLWLESRSGNQQNHGKFPPRSTKAIHLMLKQDITVPSLVHIGPTIAVVYHLQFARPGIIAPHHPVASAPFVSDQELIVPTPTLTRLPRSRVRLYKPQLLFVLQLPTALQLVPLSRMT